MKPVLLLVDLQNDFLRVGELEPHPAGVIAAAADLLGAGRETGVPIVHIWSTVGTNGDNRMPHWKKADLWNCLEGSHGHACPELLRPRKSEPVLHKTFFSAFSTDQLEAILRGFGADAVIIAGVHLHACVRTTALDAYAKGFQVIIAEDASASAEALHAALTRRYLQDRSILFRSANVISAALRAGGEQLVALINDDEASLISHVCPSDPDRTWQMPATQNREIDAAIATARVAFGDWRALSSDNRLTLLKRWSDQLARHEDEFVQLLIGDIGKPARYARGEVARAIALIGEAAKQVDQTQDGAPGKTGYRRMPHGVIGLIGPFNNPLAIPLGKIVPALLYGNVVIWKPAIPGSRIAQRAAELFAGATAHPAALQILCGGEITARRLMAKSDAVTLSGSLKAGRTAQEICGANHIPLQAELGGNNAAIIWRDADLGAAATSVAEGAFVFAGQRCTANRRVIVDAEIYASFLEELVGATARLEWGDPSQSATQMGPLISAVSRGRVEAMVSRARALGFRIMTPLPMKSGLRGDAWLEPTIICCDDAAAEVVQEETFGPVLVVQRAETWDDAISLCNGVKQGLAAAVFSESRQFIDDFFHRARAGILKVNCSTADAAVDLPFGGWKASGIGPPEHGIANREFFTRMQAVYFP